MHILVLTGAGISAESGLDTFRDKDGLWEGHDVRDVATPEGFIKQPSLVYGFYNARKRRLVHKEVKPNEAHYALARLQEAIPETTIVTQNVDNLHERSGAQDIIHMHGNILETQCTSCNYVFFSTADLSLTSVCPNCNRCSKLRPHVVWFGEAPFYLDRIYHLLSVCTYFIAIGTSGTVYPAAQFVLEARNNGAQCILINKEPSENSDTFHEHYYGNASIEVPKVINKLIYTAHESNN